MILCLCRGVSDRSIRAVIAAGASCPGDVTRACGALIAQMGDAHYLAQQVKDE